MRLSELLAALPEKRVIGPEAADVTKIVDDSRQTTAGSLFVAVRGTATDAHKFVPSAAAKGAVAVVTEREIALESNEQPVTQIIVPNTRQALAWLAAAFYGYPGRKLRVIGVTGTDGKTTTSNILAAMMRAGGHKVGMITTVNAEIGDRVLETGLHTTTPSPLEVQAFLREMVDAGSRFAVIETTSHALDQERTLGSEYDVAVVTNVTHDHLDYHKTYEAYLAAKGKLFASLSSSFHKRGVSKVSVLNAEDRSFEYLKQFTADKVYTYGLSDRFDLWASDVELSVDGTRFVINYNNERGKHRIPVQCSLLGAYNVYNILAAASAALSQNVSGRAIAEGVASIKRIVGRMDPIDLGQNFKVLVDFAHTPNALKQMLTLTRTLTQGKVIVVFGCAGLRDQEKRPLMGETAGRLADMTVITAEDPRTEDLNSIMAEVATGAEKAGRREGEGYWKIGDRGEAIDFAIRAAKSGDLVVVTGKGHEKSMCFGNTEYPWSDHEAVTQSLKELLK
jgi:UDP-N-acetylmuramoyl-L-alanyl-D-glutamate--2,6-diaminopimelate ligase